MTLRTLLTVAALIAPAGEGGDMTFDEAFDRTMGIEGGGKVHEVAGDPGGLTKWGIAQRYHPDVDVASLTRDGAAAIYREKYWNAVSADHLPAEYRFDVFDAAVNPGVRVSGRLLQEAINLCAPVPMLTTDGLIGPRTLQAAELVPADRVRVTFRALRARYYLSRVERSPHKRKFIVGWLRRAAAEGEGC